MQFKLWRHMRTHPSLKETCMPSFFHCRRRARCQCTRKICVAQSTSSRIVRTLASPMVTIRTMAKQNDESSTVSAEQPAEGSNFPLSKLSRASAKTGGSWVVNAFRPAEDNYEYTWQGKTRHGTNFVVTLVSAEDPSQHCQAHFKQKLEERSAVRASKEGNTTWHALHNVQGWLRRECEACICQLSSETCCGFVFNQDGCLPHNTSQCCTACSYSHHCWQRRRCRQPVLRCHCFDPRSAGRAATFNRSFFVVNIHDGSLDPDTKKVKVMPLTSQEQ